MMFRVRKAYYNLIDRISNNKLYKNFTGFGLYDKRIIEILRQFDDPYPYFRGLISEVGFKKALSNFYATCSKTRYHFEQFLWTV
jgi:hypothetical protein